MGSDSQLFGNTSSDTSLYAYGSNVINFYGATVKMLTVSGTGISTPGTLDVTSTATFSCAAQSVMFTGSDPDQGFTLISTATGGRSYGFKSAGSASGNIPGAGFYLYDNTGTGIVLSADTSKTVKVHNNATVGGTLGVTGLVNVGGSSPASGAAGTAGTITWDATYLYVCTASGVWKRVALTGGY
jgi:hypothetical protein